MWTLHDAKNRFSAVVEAALAGVPQKVTRRGKPAVVVVSEAEYRELLKAAQLARPDFAQHLLSFPSGDIDRAEVRARDVGF